MSSKITMVGTGYVGLVTGACFAEIGHDVICVDKDPKKIETLNKNGIPIYEPGLEDIVARNTRNGGLRFSLDLGESVKGRDAIFIAVGTPSNSETGGADLRYVTAAAAEIAANLDQFSVIVTKSTVPVGTNRLVGEIAAKHLRPDMTAGIASNPEFLREGSAISDFMKPDRIVVGVEDERSADVMRRIYAPFMKMSRKFILTDIETAEIIKYAANAFLAVKISYINEVADLCEAVGADVEKVAIGIGSDQRIGSAFLKVGPGWGGSCFPKDTRALHTTATDNGVPMRIVEAAIESNTRRKKSIVNRIEAACGGSLAGKKLAVFGLTFKGQTDDMRESPSLDVVPALLARGAEVQAFDPSMPADALRLLPNVLITETPISAARGADALIVLTDWSDFLKYDLADIAKVMTDPVMIDLRNMFDEGTVRQSGFRRYAGMGRRAAQSETRWGMPSGVVLNGSGAEAPAAG
jgi:UDPglucose 6-dehydrogenase